MSADWEVELSFQIAGTQTLGGDGLAFWYAKDAGQEGPVFGSRDRWLGLGVFVDTYDNDGGHDNPRISVVANDGTRSYNPTTDGRDIELGGCVAPLRRTPEPVGLLVRYDGAAQRLRVEYSTAPGRWTECVAATVALPRGYRFGVSAATGALSDTHDVYRFVTRRLRSDDDDNNAAAPAAAAPATAAPTAPAQEPDKNAEVEELRRQIEELRRAAQKPAPEESAPAKEAPKAAEKEQPKEEVKPRAQPETEKKEAPAPAAAPAAQEEQKKAEEEDAVVVERLARLETAVRATAARTAALADAAAGLAAAERAAAALRVPEAQAGAGGAFDDAALRAELAQQLLQLRRSVEQAQDAVRGAVGTHTDALRGRLAALGTALADAAADGARTSSRSSIGSALVVVFVLVQVAFAGAMVQLFRRQGHQKKFL